MLLCGRNAKCYTANADQSRDIRNFKEAFAPAHILFRGSIFFFTLMLFNLFYNFLNPRLCRFYVLPCVRYPISSVRSGVGPLDFTLLLSDMVFHRRCNFTAQEWVLYPCAHSLLTYLANGLSSPRELNSTGIGTDHASTLSQTDTCRQTSATAITTYMCISFYPPTLTQFPKLWSQLSHIFFLFVMLRMDWKWETFVVFYLQPMNIHTEQDSSCCAWQEKKCI